MEPYLLYSYALIEQYYFLLSVTGAVILMRWDHSIFVLR